MSSVRICSFVLLLSVTFNALIAEDLSKYTPNKYRVNNFGDIGKNDSLPLAVGNKWYYQVYSHGQNQGITVAEIIKDTVFEDGNTYFKFNFSSFLPQGNREFLRCDSGKIYFLNYWDSTTTPVLDFASTPGESHTIVFPPYSLVYFTISDSLTIFNKLTKVFQYSLDGLQIASIQVSPDFGFLKIEDYGDTGSIIPAMSYTLKGCILSGIEYGDVSSIEKSSTAINDFILMQNYPNPFNGETIIKYYLKSGSNYSLTLYDINGRRVKTLKEGYADAGLHNFSLISDELSSGVYFVRLIAQNISRGIKVVVLK